jgi:hypothetical protein
VRESSPGATSSERLKTLQAVLLASAEETAVAKREALTLRRENAHLVLRLAASESRLRGPSE